MCHYSEIPSVLQCVGLWVSVVKMCAELLRTFEEICRTWDNILAKYR